MKEENELPKASNFLEIISKAVEGQDSLIMRFSQITDGYHCFINDVYLTKIAKDQLDPLLKKLWELTVSFGLKPEITTGL